MRKHGFLWPGLHVAGHLGQRARMAQQHGKHPAWLLVEHIVHLTNFYGKVGFIVTPPEFLQNFFAERLAGGVATSRQTVAMNPIPG